MRKLRLKNDGEGFYHVGTRCVGRAMMFGDDDKTHIVDQILRMAEFCGMEVNLRPIPGGVQRAETSRAALRDGHWRGE